MAQMTETLGEALPREIKRCQELVQQYISIGPAGTFGCMMIQRDIDNAVKALASGDMVEMIRCYEALKGCK